MHTPALTVHFSILRMSFYAYRASCNNWTSHPSSAFASQYPKRERTGRTYVRTQGLCPLKFKLFVCWSCPSVLDEHGYVFNKTMTPGIMHQHIHVFISNFAALRVKENSQTSSRTSIANNNDDQGPCSYGRRCVGSGFQNEHEDWYDQSSVSPNSTNHA